MRVPVRSPSASPRGRLGPPVLMAGGLFVVGAAGYAFVALAGHTLPPADAAAVSALYLLVNLIGPGVFGGLEQETSRSVSAALAEGGTVGAVRRAATVNAAGLLVALLVVLGGLAPVLVPRTLGGHAGVFAALLLGVAANALIYLARGLLGGTRRFTGYAVTLAVEGVARLLPCVLLAVLGGANAVGYALVFALGSAVGALAGWPWLRGLATGPADRDRPVHGMTRRLALLVGSTTLLQLLANLAPIVLAGRLVGDAPMVAAFTAAFVLVRLPLTAFAPVQALLLPTLTAAATRGERAVVRRLLGRITAAAVGVGALGTLGAWALGPWAVRVLFGAHAELGRPVLAALGAGTLLLMVALVLQPGLVALGRHRLATGSWLAGTIVLVGLLWLPGDPLRAVVLAQVAGSAAVVLGMAVAAFAATASRPTDE